MDLFVIGDGEEAIVELVRAYQERRGEPREAQLRALARIPGVYVPRFYDVRYNADGTVAAIEPNVPEARCPCSSGSSPRCPRRRRAFSCPTWMFLTIERRSRSSAAVRAGCRFCHAGMVVRPVRERPVEEVLEAIEAILRQTGFEEVGLLSLSSSDYSGIGDLVQAIGERFGGEHLSVSLPALRADSFSVGLAEAVAQGTALGFTFAPEAATERLRGVINKPITTEQMLDVAREVFERGWRTIKLYFMIGLPGERMEDVQAIADLARAVRRWGARRARPQGAGQRQRQYVRAQAAHAVPVGGAGGCRFHP